MEMFLIIFCSIQNPIHMSGTVLLIHGQIRARPKSISILKKRLAVVTKKCLFMLLESEMVPLGSSGKGNYRLLGNTGSIPQKPWMRWMREGKFTGPPMAILAEKSI